MSEQSDPKTIPVEVGPTPTGYSTPTEPAPVRPIASQGPGCTYIGLRVLAAILAILFVFSLPVALFLSNMERIAFNADTYKQALNRVDFYTQLPVLMAGTISESVAKNPADNQALARLSESDIQEIAGGLITREWAQTQTESAIDQLFKWLNSDQRTLSVTISMAEVKKRMAGPEGESAALKVVTSWPACTDAQLLAATAAVAADNMAQMPACRPPDNLMPQVTPYFSEVAAQGAAGIPDTLDLAAPNGTPPDLEGANDPRPTLRIYRTVAAISPILPALLLLAIAALVVRSWRSMALWWGIPLVIAAIFGGLLAIGMLPLRDMLTQSVVGASSPIATSLEDVVTRVFGYVFQMAGWWIGGESAVVGGGGLILFLAGYLLGRQPPKPDYMSGGMNDGYSPR